MVIHRNSKHPVLVKKIALKIWLLRDEIENVIKNRLIYAKQNNLKCDISDIKEEYSGSKDSTSPAPDTILNNLQAKEEDKKEESSEDNSQDDLAAQMEASLDEDVDTGEENKDENKEESGEEGKEEDLAAQMEASLNEDVDTKKNEEDSSKKVTKDSDLKIFQRVLHLEKNKLNTGKTILSEISMDQIYLFCDKKLFEGQSIVIEFQIPNKFHLNADVIFCNKFNLKNRIISKHNLSHRVCAKFTFMKKGEMTLLRKFLTSVEPEIEKEKEKKTEEGEDGEDSGGIDDILDGLDL